MANARHFMTDYSKTQRIVLLIDLNPLLHFQNPEPYITTLITSAKTLLSFPPISSSLFSFKFLFSSLSPLLSSSKLPFSSLSLSFDHPDTTVQSLTSLLNTFLKERPWETRSFSPSRAVHVAASMRQLVHDYAWDPVIYDSVTGKILDDCDGNSFLLSSNLVVLFSPIVKSCKLLSEFLDVDMDDECLRNVELFHNQFRGFFECVNDAFHSRDIRVSWIDVKHELESNGGNEFELQSKYFQTAIGGLGWGFCSSDSIALGSSILQFGLIYPWIAIPSPFFKFDKNYSKTINAQLNLEILDVSGKPLECKCCDLELVSEEIIPKNDVLVPTEFTSSQNEGNEKNRILRRFDGGNGILKLRVKALRRYEDYVNFEGKLSGQFVVHECSRDPVKGKKDENGGFSDFFADRVLKILAIEMGEFWQRKAVPTWQLFLNFLYKNGFWALVSFVDKDGISQTGILKPFTVFTAHLSVICNDSFGAKSDLFITKMEKKVLKSDGSSEAMRKKNKRDRYLLQDLTWKDFCKAAYGNTVLDLEEIYFAKRLSSSKKLKFLKCWMRQILRSRNCSSIARDPSVPLKDVLREEKEIHEWPQESEGTIPASASVREEPLTDASRIQDDAAIDIRSENLESFISNLPEKMEQGLESEGVDLGALAHRLVNSSILWLYQKHETENTSEDPCGSNCAVELSKLLLKEPKDLIAMRKNKDPSDNSSTEHVVREYELQILFRMEILQSEVGTSIEEPMKQKFVKQICLLLDAIQCHLQGGFFDDWSLDNYMHKFIKSRYCHTLGDVVHKIYRKMDLLLFADEDDPPICLLRSEDSNQSWREKEHKGEVGENSRLNESVSVQDETHHLHETDNESPQGVKRAEHIRKVIEAQERRERARRFASFTSWVPDLQRVWAPKQPKGVKPKSLLMALKRKDNKRASYDKVCETPMTGSKRSCSRGSSSTDEVGQDYLSHAVSKALFQDDWSD